MNNTKPIEPLNLSLSEDLKNFMKLMEFCQAHFDKQFEELILKPVRESEQFSTNKNKQI